MEFETDMQAQAFQQVFNQYKAQAKRKKREFTLSLQDFFVIVTSKCYLCGELPSNVSVWNGYKLYSPLKPIGRSPVSFVYSGIDRKDNDIGYLKENCFPCCIRCNMGKKGSSLRSFLEWIENVYKKSIQNRKDYEK